MKYVNPKRILFILMVTSLILRISFIYSNRNAWGNEFCWGPDEKRNYEIASNYLNGFGYSIKNESGHYITTAFHSSFPVFIYKYLITNGIKIEYWTLFIQFLSTILYAFSIISFYRIINFLSEDYLPKDVGDFQLIDRKVIDILKEVRDNQPYIRGTIASIGFKQIGIPYDRNSRTKGKSKFSMSSLISLALDGILNHSIIPLRIATFVGIFISIITFILAITYFIGKIIYGPTWSSGFATTTILILLSISLNTLFLGVIGEYLGRIYKQVKKRPLTIIDKKVNI